MNDSTVIMGEIYLLLSGLVPVFIFLIFILLVVIMFTLLVAVGRLTNIRTELAYLAEDKINQDNTTSKEQPDKEYSPSAKKLLWSMYASILVGIFGVIVMIVGLNTITDSIGLLMSSFVGGIFFLGGVAMGIYSYITYKKESKDERDRD